MIHSADDLLSLLDAPDLASEYTEAAAHCLESVEVRQVAEGRD